VSRSNYVETGKADLLRSVFFREFSVFSFLKKNKQDGGAVVKEHKCLECLRNVT